MMNVNEFCDKLIDIAQNYKTLYVLGCFGAPMTSKNKTRYSNNNSYNSNRKNLINNATEDTFGFDCVCLIKGILWGWNGNKNKIYGGAIYKTNNVPDIGANTIINNCKNISTNFANIEKGELVWIKGHVGIYVGDGKVVECTPKWTNNVQITNLGNIAEYKKGNYRIWTKHGKLPYINYVTNETQKESTIKKSNEEIARECIKGLWGNGNARRCALIKAGYDYKEVQSIVNQLLQK